MKNYEKLVWKLIDREISDSEFAELQNELLSNRKLRDYYQECLEMDSTLTLRHYSPFLDFKENETGEKKIPFLWVKTCRTKCFICKEVRLKWIFHQKLRS